ncbi:MAG: hypothetical protein WC685_01685 [Methylobacter sp.]|jgi:hypothetical protein
MEISVTVPWQVFGIMRCFVFINMKLEQRLAQSIATKNELTWW